MNCSTLLGKSLMFLLNEVRKGHLMSMIASGYVMKAGMSDQAMSHNLMIIKSPHGMIK